MSNRWAGVRGWAGVGACSAEGVCDGRNLAKIRFRHRWRPKDPSEEGGEQGSEGGRWRFCWDFIYTNIVGYCGVVRLSVHKRFGWWHVRGAD